MLAMQRTIIDEKLFNRTRNTTLHSQTQVVHVLRKAAKSKCVVENKHGVEVPQLEMLSRQTCGGNGGMMWILF